MNYKKAFTVILALIFTCNIFGQYISRPVFKEESKNLIIDYFIFDTRPQETYNIKFTFFDKLNNPITAFSLSGDYPTVKSTEESSFHGRVVWDVLKDRQDIPKIDYIKAEITSKLETRGIPIYIKPSDKITVMFSDVDDWADCNLNGSSILSCRSVWNNKGKAQIILPPLKYGQNTLIITTGNDYQQYTYDISIYNAASVIWKTKCFYNQYDGISNKSDKYQIDLIVSDKAVTAYIDYTGLAFKELLEGSGNSSYFEYPYRYNIGYNSEYGFYDEEILGRDFIWNGSQFNDKVLYRHSDKQSYIWYDEHWIPWGKQLKEIIPHDNTIKYREFTQSSSYSQANSWPNKLTRYTKARLEQWKTKGEFEKSADYLIRTNAANTSAQLELIYTEAKEFYKTLWRARFTQTEFFMLKEYDADSECYRISTDLMQDFFLSVPINYAANFKTNFHIMTIVDLDFDITDNKILIRKINFKDQQNNIFSFQK